MLTFLLGLTFLFIQINEYIHIGFAPSDNAQASMFYGLTGLHGAHVFVGLCLLLTVVVRTFRGHFSPEHHHGVEVPGIYWHFVDIMWVRRVRDDLHHLMRIKDPVRSEQGMFELLIWVVAVVAVLVVVLLVVRASHLARRRAAPDLAVSAIRRGERRQVCRTSGTSHGPPPSSRASGACASRSPASSSPTRRRRCTCWRPATRRRSTCRRRTSAATSSSRPTRAGRRCEFKGRADYLDVVVGGDRRRQAAWTYPDAVEGLRGARAVRVLLPGPRGRRVARRRARHRPGRRLLRRLDHAGSRRAVQGPGGHAGLVGGTRLLAVAGGVRRAPAPGPRRCSARHPAGCRRRR